MTEKETMMFVALKKICELVHDRDIPYVEVYNQVRGISKTMVDTINNIGMNAKTTGTLV